MKRSKDKFLFLAQSLPPVAVNDRITLKRRKFLDMTKDKSDEKSAIWAVTTLLVVVLMLAIIYFGGLFNNSDKVKKGLIDRNANAAPPADNTR